jgi:hypothetical protein
MTAREIAELDPYLKVICFTEGLTQGNLDAFFTEGGHLDIVVEECDSVDIKILARQKARSLRIPVVMDMSDRGCLDIERFDLEPERPLMHGWIDHLDLKAAARPMSAEEKIPYMLPITGVDTLSPRMKASVIELGRSLSTWPQLATSVVLGGALAGDAVRRIALRQMQDSGRWFVDLDELIPNTGSPSMPDIERSGPPAPLKLSEAHLQAFENWLGATPWDAEELDPGTMAQLIEAGGLAPSAGNMQPWKFHWSNNRLLLLHDVSRSYSALDPDHRIAHIALGACMENVILKAHSLGLEVITRTDGAPHPLLASFSFQTTRLNGQEAHDLDHLVEHIGMRCTNRKVTAHSPLPTAIREELLAAASSITGTRGTIFQEAEQLAELASICGIAERIRVLNPTGHREFFGHELRWNEEEAQRTRDGLDLATLEIGPKDVAGLRVASDPRTRALLEAWGGGRNLEQMAVNSIRNSSAVLLLSISGDTTQARLAGGRAAERAWLSATGSGWSVHPISAPIFLTHVLRYDLNEFAEHESRELSDLKMRMDHLFQLPGEDQPLFMFRISKAGSPSTRSLRSDIKQLMAEMA